MSDEVHLWRVDAEDVLTEIDRVPLDLESRLQEWLARDISVLDPSLLVIGREIPTDFGGFIDILCVDAEGNTVVVELKRDKTPREITAQVLDYASWVANLSNERITSIANAYLDDRFDDSFRSHFETQVPETLNGSHRLVVVGSQIDPSSERIIRYLSDTHGVDINAATFHYFRPPEGPALLARVFLIDESEAALNTRTKGASKRAPRLTYEELHSAAESNGVGDIYDSAVKALEPVLQKHTTSSGVGFAASVEGGRKTILSLLPTEKGAEPGLMFRLYKHRYAGITGLSVEQVAAHMPARRQEWSYITGDDPEWAGYEGFIVDVAEVERLTAPLRAAAARSGTSLAARRRRA